MSKVAFVTYRENPRLTVDDSLAFRPLGGHGIKLASAAWDDPSVRWADFALLVLRSTWNYHLKLNEFSLWLDRIKADGLVLYNAPNVVRWNMDKSYLRDLAERGIPIPPTVYLDKGAAVDLGAILEEKGWREAVVKPTVGASAHGVQRLSAQNLAGSQHRLERLLQNQAAMLQPFISEITQGEWSLIFFRTWDGTISYSHAVRKQPKTGDFRTQEEYGSDIVADTPSDGLLAWAWQTVQAVTGDWLYARVDGVVTEDQFWLMELELIEPSLFLWGDRAAPIRFAEAIASLLS